MKLEIRPVKPDEVPQTSAIYVDCWQHDYRGIVPTELIEGFDIDLEAEQCRNWLYEETEDLRLLYVAIIDNQVVGYTSATLVDPSLEVDYEIEICDLFVRKEYRGQGIGRELLKVMAQVLKERGYSSLILYNWRELESNKFYRYLGGKIIKEEIQNCGEKKMKTDIFGWQIDDLISHCID